MKTLYEKGIEGHSCYFKDDVEKAIKETYFAMPWAILSPLGKKAIEIAFKDIFGYDYISGFALHENTGVKKDE